MPAHFRSIREIDAQQWDRLAGDNPLATHGWLQTVENTCRTKLEPLYFTLYRDETLVAGAVCYVFTPTCEIESVDDLLFGRVKSLARTVGLGFLPALVCGPVLGYGWHIGVAPSLDAPAARQAASDLLDLMEAEAGGRGLDLHFIHVLDDEREMRQLLAERGYHRCRNAPIAKLEVAWDSFDDYIAAMPRKRRAEFRRQINRNRDSGQATERAVAGQDPEAPLLDLIDGNRRTHGNLPFPMGEGLVGQLQRHFGPCARIFTSRGSERLNGMMLMLVRGPVAYALAVGVEPTQDRRDYTYFQVCYNEPIAYAAENGIRRIYYGRGMYELKLRRGCTLTGNWVYSRLLGRRRLIASGWYPVASRWNLRKLPSAAQRILRDSEAS